MRFMSKGIVTNEELMRSRPELSRDNLERFYDVLYNSTKSDEMMDLDKNVFLMLSVNPQVERDVIAESLHISKSLAYREMLTVLRIIFEIENNVKITDPDYIPPSQMIPVREPRAYAYTDQHGKTWACMNEFFGLT